MTQAVIDATARIRWMIVAALDLQRPSYLGQFDHLRERADGYLFVVDSEGTHHSAPRPGAHFQPLGKGDAIVERLRIVDGGEGSFSPPLQS